MKPGDLAIIKCKKRPGLTGRVVILLEWQKPTQAFQGSRWICLLDGVERSIQSGWLKEVK